MGNITEARHRIAQASASGAKKLNLRGLELTTAELKQLVPDIQKKVPNVVTLDLSNNKLTEIPNEIKNFTALKNLNLSSNKITNLPISTLFKLNRTLDSFDLTNNQLSVKTMSSLQSAHLSGKVQMDMDKSDALLLELYREGHTAVKEQLETIYGDEAKSKIDELASLEQGSYINDEGREMTAHQVVADFLGKVPLTAPNSAQIYQVATKEQLDEVLAPNLSEDDKKGRLQMMATSLGNCPTPVKKYLIQSHIGKHPDDKSLLPLIASLAVEDKIVKSLSNQLSKEERIEQVQGLVNSLFLENAENNSKNKTPIAGDRERLPSTTQYVDYAFEKVTEPLAQAFATLCCKTDDQGQLLKEGGCYQFDQSKMNAIVEPFLADLGIVSEREQVIAEYESKIQDVIADNDDLYLHMDDENVLAAIDTTAQKNALRALLSKAGDADVQAVFEDYLAEKTRAVEDLGAKYGEGNMQDAQQEVLSTPEVKDSQTQNQNDPWAAMTVPLNQGQRPTAEAHKRSKTSSMENLQAVTHKQKTQKTMGM
ncbi:MAG: leucine-rich repeat domain-containing protein [Bacteroidota bacterium]